MGCMGLPALHAIPGLINQEKQHFISHYPVLRGAVTGDAIWYILSWLYTESLIVACPPKGLIILLGAQSGHSNPVLSKKKYNLIDWPVLLNTFCSWIREKQENRGLGEQLYHGPLLSSHRLQSVSV